LAEAADHLATAVRLDPNRATSHHHLGLALSRQGKAIEAIASHRAAVAIAPSLAEAHFELGRLHYERRSRDPAAEAFERAAAATPNTSKGREAAARALIARGQREEAIAVLRRARKLRHPVDTCLSIYTTYLASPGLEFMGNREDLVFYYREYERLMRHWRQVLPPERFVEIDYEWLITDREAETRWLLSFSGLKWNDACLRPESNRRSVETASVWQARQPVYRSSVARWRNYEPWLGPLAQLMPGEAVP
jgi:tetratricopeptide (TPR) repeat protein